MSSVGKALQILFLLSREPEPIGVHEIARRLQMTPPTVHRLLSALAAHDLVQGAGRRSEYRLGWACLDLARAFLGGTGIAEVAQPIAQRLRDRTAETVTAQVPVAFEQICILEAEGLHELRRRVMVGRRLPLHAGASGRAILAFLPPDEIEAYLARPLEKIGPNTLTDTAELRARLEETRRTGIATSTEESVVGVVGISVPVFARDGRIAGSLSVSGPEARLGPEMLEEIRPQLVEAGHALSRELGYQPERARQVREEVLVAV